MNNVTKVDRGRFKFNPSRFFVSLTEGYLGPWPILLWIGEFWKKQNSVLNQLFTVGRGGGSIYNRMCLWSAFPCIYILLLKVLLDSIVYTKFVRVSRKFILKIKINYIYIFGWIFDFSMNFQISLNNTRS